MQLILIYLFLNYDLFNCDKVRKFPARSYKRLPPAQMEDTTEHEADEFIKKLRKEIQMAESARRAMDVDLNFGFGLEDYSIEPMDVFDNPKINHSVQRNLPEMHREPDLTTERNEEFMNYDITPMFWTGTPKIGQTEQYTTPESFIPTPEGFQLTTESLAHTTSPPAPDPWQNFENLPGLETSSPPSQFVSFDPNHLPEYPDHPVEGTSFNPFPPIETTGPYIVPGGELQPSTPFNRPTFPFSVPPVSTLPVDFNIGQTHEPVSPSAFTWITFPDMPAPNLTSSVSEESDIPTTTMDSMSPLIIEITSPSAVSTMTPPTPISSPSFRGSTPGPAEISKSKNKNIWMKFRPGIDKSLMNLLRINVSRDAPIDLQPPKDGRTLSKAESLIHKLYGKPFVNENPKMTAGSTQTVFTKGLMSPGVRGSLHVSPRVDNITNRTTAGMLQNASNLSTPVITGTNKKYYDMMQQLHEGFLGIFLLEFTRILSEKEEQHIREIIMPIEILLKGYDQNAIMSWFEVLNNTVALKAILNMTRTVFSDRKRYLAEDVNAVLDFVNLFYNNEQGEYLFNTLRELERYPDGPGTDMDLCRNLLIAVIDPIHKKISTDQGNQLKILIIGVLSARGQRRMSYRHLLKLPDSETTILNPSSNYNQIYSLKQRMEMKRRRNNLARRMFDTAGVLLAQLTNQPMEQPKLRSMIPITRNQKRFRVITKRQRAVTNLANIERPTRNDHFRKSGRVIHPYNEMMQFFPQIPKEYLRHVL